MYKTLKRTSIKINIKIIVNINTIHIMVKQNILNITDIFWFGLTSQTSNTV